MGVEGELWASRRRLEVKEEIERSRRSYKRQGGAGNIEALKTSRRR